MALALLAAWFVVVRAMPAQEAPKQEPPGGERAKQIEEIRRQIAELNKRLDALSKEPVNAPAAAPAVTLPAGYLKRLQWRSIGPACMGGRISALAVYEADPTTFWVATASGGLLKSENAGLSFQHQFDREATVSIGDVAVAPSDKKIVWVGTGEANPRNSVSYGDGVYKSTDGGKSWTNLGLKESFQIGRIAIHPKDPNIVYVGALGRLYGPSAERGLFKTQDGGKTWTKILFVDDKTGVIDVAMSPADPETLLVATYERRRDLYDTNDPAVKFGAGSGLQKTTDGGKTWTKVTKGLPTGKLGRIGLSFGRKDPKVVMAVVESELIGTGPPQAVGPTGYLGIVGSDAEDKAQIAEVVAGGPAEKAGLLASDLVLELEGKPLKKYEALVELLREKKPGEVVKFKIQRGEETKEIVVTLGERPAGRTPGAPRDPKKPFLDFLGGQRENIQGRQGDEAFQYGGVYRSTDGGDSWERVNSLNPRPMYFSQIRVDPSDDQLVYVLGIALYRSKDGGKTFRPDGGRSAHSDHHALWIDPRDGRHVLLGGDGGVYATVDRMESWDYLNQSAIGQFYDVALDSRRLYWVFGGLQDNGSWGGPSRTLGFTGPVNEDWLFIGDGDGFGCEVDPEDPRIVYFTSQNGAIGRRNLFTGEVAFFQPRAPKDVTYRFNWNTPFTLSSHNPHIYYTAGNFVFRSLKRGGELKPISPEITRTDKGSATSLAESPRNPGVLYVGTDDGALWLTKDGGREWTDIAKNIGLPRPMHVSSIEASRFAEGRVYVAFDGHRSDLDDPFAFVSDDFGQTFRALNAGLPRGSTRCLREDIKNPDLLFLGTEFKTYVSIDRGLSWTSLNTNLPTVAVHQIAVHPDPEVGEIVAATHGRSLWVLDATPLRQLTADVLKARAHLFQPTVQQRWHPDPTRGTTNRQFTGTNPPQGAPIYFHLGEKANQISVKIYDAAGELVRTLAVPGEPGLHRTIWDLARLTPRSERVARTTETRVEPTGEGTQSGEGGLQQLLNIRPRQAEPGTYKVVLAVDDKEFVKTIRIEADPRAPDHDYGRAEQEDEANDEEMLERATIGDIDD
jgi:photosystem II stability/assembly factor-like uncharacterized protein